MMEDIKVFNQSDLVLAVNPICNPEKLDLEEWEPFLETLCGDREYQKEAIRAGILFLASGNYENTEGLVAENFAKNKEIQKKYEDLDSYLQQLQIRGKLFANIDLATGSGKTYVMYGIARMMMGLGLVSRVLVLCPSLTIEKGLTQKFTALSANPNLRNSIPDSAKLSHPGIVDANSTVKAGDICIENIHAVYERTGSSISDSFQGRGRDTLVLNDESHHIFNAIQGVSGNSQTGRGLKEWKKFLLHPDYDFHYILGFTGTAYHDNEYFNDVIYRYSLRQAIDDGIVKSINYVQKDESGDDYEKFQKIYQNHLSNQNRYEKLKPITILITRDIKSAKRLWGSLLEFLQEEEAIGRESAEGKVLIVTSDKEHAKNLLRLPYVDEREDATEWIVSVSMLTEGWDVKNVFQIVPWEDRAFNSKLLIAQVLGRGLRIPAEYQSPQPYVTVFNHDAWSRNIRSLVHEVLEIETKIVSSLLEHGERSAFHFSLFTLRYNREEKEIPHPEKEVFDYSVMWKSGIQLDSQVEVSRKETLYENMFSGSVFSRDYEIKKRMVSVDEIVRKIHREFKMRDWESQIFGLSDDEVYSKSNLPPREKLRELVKRSMKQVGIQGDALTEKNAQKVYNAFSTLFRKKGKTVRSELQSAEPVLVETTALRQDSMNLRNFRKEASLFYTDAYEDEIEAEEQKRILELFFEDDTFPRSASFQINRYLMKTPVDVVMTDREPERKFLQLLCKKENARMLRAWVKSRNTGFYTIDYSVREGTHSKQRGFNPDFFLDCSVSEGRVILVLEIKMDGDDSRENRAKYRYGKAHFRLLNETLKRKGIEERYLFHFLSPNGYDAFFAYLRDGRLLEGEDSFRCELENLLENGKNEG